MSGDRLTRRNLIVFGCGPKESGKTRFMWTHYTRHQKRVITLDYMREARELDSRTIETFGLKELRGALRHVATAGREWHIAANLASPDELLALLRILAPDDPRKTGYARAVGGLTLEGTEIDEWFPLNAPPEAKSIFRRARHHLLNIFAATQRPASVARDVTSQADVLYTFAHWEPRELEWITRTFGRELADEIALLPQYHAAVFVKRERTVYFLDADGHAYRHEPIFRATRRAQAG